MELARPWRHEDQLMRASSADLLLERSSGSPHRMWAKARGLYLVITLQPPPRSWTGVTKVQKRSPTRRSSNWSYTRSSGMPSFLDALFSRLWV